MCDLVAPLLVIFDNGKLHASLHRTHASVYKRLKGWAIEFYPLALEPLVTALTRSQSSLSLSLIFTREARSRGSAWGGGKEEREESLPFRFSSSHHASRSLRSRFSRSVPASKCR